MLDLGCVLRSLRYSFGFGSLFGFRFRSGLSRRD